MYNSLIETLPPNCINRWGYRQQEGFAIMGHYSLKRLPRQLPDGTIEILLTRGFVAIIDDCDSDLAAFNWGATVEGYAVRGTRKKTSQEKFRMHRIILERKLGRKLLSSEEVDHIHGITGDNRRSEIRLATHSQNTKNRKPQINCASKYKGVSKHGKKWQSRIQVNGESLYLGVFNTQEEAYARYCEASKMHQEFARVK